MFTIYCHAGLIEPIKAICGFTLQKKFTSLFGERILFTAVSDGDQKCLSGYGVTFLTSIPPRPNSSALP
jgi:ribonuclease Z